MLLQLLTITAFAQGMSDQQILEFISTETKAGTSRKQIVTKLMQKGVKVEQIRRLRAQYGKQLSNQGLSGSADEILNGLDNKNDLDNDLGKRVSPEEEYAVSGKDSTGVVTKKSGKLIYGHDIFNQKNLSFEPNSNLATPANYVLGPGDQVVINIYGASQHTLTHTISPEGTVTVKDYGPIYLSGLTVEAAQAKLRNTIGSRYQSSSLKVSVGNTRTILINVMGEVNTPGTYRLSPFSTVFYALYHAGGVKELGTLRNVRLIRNGRLVTVIDIYDFILNGRLAGNITLQDNDVIQVGPYETLVNISGNVKRPMFYEMRKDESVGTLIKYAGGFTGDAYKKSVQLVRQGGERYSMYTVDEFDMGTFKVEDGDSVIVGKMVDRYENLVEVKGAVFRPGQFQLGGKITSVKTLIEAADGIKEEAFTNHAVMHRLKEDRTLEIIPVDVKGILDGTVADIPLKNEDVLFILTQEDFMNERTLTITGSVMSPGVYVYAENSTIEDLIVQAGGLTDDATLARVEVSRRIMDRHATTKSNELSKQYTFQLKDGLLIDEDRNFLLEPYDVVHIRRSPAMQPARNINISGEVNFEGAYTLSNKQQRLSDAIQMAGGLTEAANLRGATLVRMMNDEERIRQQATLKAVQNLLAEKKDSINYKKLALGKTYPVGIDLAKAIEVPGCDADILLREGDSIFVPEYNNVVKISGDVMFPNSVFFDGNKSYKDYIKQAGGYGNMAKKSKVFIVYQNGQVGLAKKGAKPEPGCEIVVPSKTKRAPLNLTAITSVVSSLTTVAALIAYLTK